MIDFGDGKVRTPKRKGEFKNKALIREKNSKVIKTLYGYAPKKKIIRSKPQFVPFLDIKDVPPGTVNSEIMYGQEIAIVNEKGKLYAISNKLPPTGQPATFGKLSGDGTIRDPTTGTKFSLKTGEVVGKWCPSGVGLLVGALTAPSKVATFPVKKFGRKIQVQINVNAKAQFEQGYWRGILDSQGKTDGGYY